MIATSLVLSGGIYSTPSDTWIPLLTGFTDIKFYSATTSILLTFAFTGVTSVIIYSMNNRYIGAGKSSLALVFLYLVFLFSSPVTIFFSGTTVAAPLVILSLFNTFKPIKEEKNIFISGFLITVATLFDFHLVFLIPLIFYCSLVNDSFSIRSVLIFKSSLILPYVFIFSLRYIFFDDTLLFAELLWNDISSISTPYIKTDSVANLFLLAFILYTSYRSVSTLLGKLSSFKTIKSLAVVRLLISALLFTAIILFYPDIQGNYVTLLSIPSAFIINEYLDKGNSNKNKRVEFFILLILLVIYRISEFM